MFTVKFFARHSVLACSLFFSASFLQAETIQHPTISTESDKYAAGLLKQAIQTANASLILSESEIAANNQRAIHMLEDKELDVLWLATSTELEDSFIPVRIPIYKNLMSYQKLLVNKNSGLTATLADVDQFETLRKLKLGVVRYSNHSSILQTQQMNLVSTVKAINLLSMLEGGRFDAMPIPIASVSDILSNHPELEVVPNLVFTWADPTYFFVNIDNPELAQLITKGLTQMIESGQFDAYFKASNLALSSLPELSSESNKIIEVANIHLPKKTPLSQSKLWIKASNKEILLSSL